MSMRVVRTGEVMMLGAKRAVLAPPATAHIYQTEFEGRNPLPLRTPPLSYRMVEPCARAECASLVRRSAFDPSSRASVAWRSAFDSSSRASVAWRSAFIFVDNQTADCHALTHWSVSFLARIGARSDRPTRHRELPLRLCS